MATLEVVPAPSLYQVEETLTILADSVETVEPEQEQQFLADFAAALKAAVTKRDRVGKFLAHLESQIALADKEIKRLQERKSVIGELLDRMEGYVVVVLKSLGKDSKNRWRTLEGETVAFSLRNCPLSVAIVDETLVPDAHKNVTITMPLVEWNALLDAVDLETNARMSDVIKKTACSKTSIKSALQAAVPDWEERMKTAGRVFSDAVPGAILVAGEPNLVRS